MIFNTYLLYLNTVIMHKISILKTLKNIIDKKYYLWYNIIVY